MNLRITRLGCLAVHLMPKFTGQSLRRAVKRICKHGPKDKYERLAVLKANEEDLPDPAIKEDWQP